MPMISAKVCRAESHDDIKPLVELCKAGKLFDVQRWIEAGKPVNPPVVPPARQRAMHPLGVALDHGFHSLVEVLLRGGAIPQSDEWGCPMNRALQMRRLDMIQLLVEFGYDASTVDMEEVFATWDPVIMEYFIERGVDVERGNPLAYALCSRIRTALGVFRRYKDRFASFQEQANIALRHHCKDGNMKWVSLLLWAGADPYAPGTDNYWDQHDAPEDDGISALGYAALWGHFEVFRLKKIRLAPEHPVAHEVMRRIYDEEGFDLLQGLLKKGMNPNDEANGGCSVIQRLLRSIGFDVFRHQRYPWEKEKGIDSERSRGNIKLIHLLAKHGAQWVPKNTCEINDARRSLLKLTPDYTVEFVWIMAKYQSCERAVIEQLLRTPTIKRHTSNHRSRLNELVATWE